MRVGRLVTLAIVLLAAVLVSYQAAWSQAESGTVTGTVTDSTGGVIPGAKVMAKSVSTGAERTVETGATGQYVIPELGPGLYDITASSGSFAPFTARAEVTVGGKVTVDAQLAVSGQTTTVEVVGEGGAAVNTQSQELSQLVDSTQMSQLPSLTRDPYDFVALSGNVSNADMTSNGGTPNATFTVGQGLTARGVGYSINGQRETSTEILLDGVENVGVFSLNAGQPVPVDSIQEFSIITNNFGAEFGRASGGIVNVSTKTGTNDIHGSAFEYNRLAAYTSNTFGNNINDLPRGGYTRNQFGYNIGAPIVKNKLFGYFSQEFIRVRSVSQQEEDIFDASFVNLLPANAKAYFTTYGTPAPPVSGVVTTAGQLAAEGIFSTASFPMINGVTPVASSQPVFDTVNFKTPFDAGGGVPQNTNDLLGRVDYNFSDKTQMFGRYARYNEDDFPGAISYTPYAQFNVGGSNLANSVLYSLSHIFNPNLLSSTKLSYTRFNAASSYDTALTNTPNLYLTTSSYAQGYNPVSNNTIAMPGLENTAEGSGGLPFGGPQNTAQVFEDMAWTKGRHTMHFGFQGTYIQLNVAYGAYAQANEVLGTDVGPSLNTLVNAGGVKNAGVYASPVLQFAARVNGEGALPCPTDIYGNPITPIPASCEVTPPLPSAAYGRSYRYKDWALYAGDSFKLTRKLTVNYALRYEHYGVQHNNKTDLDSNFYDGAGTYPQNIADGQVELTQKSSVGGFWEPRWGTAAPRVGFAYDVFGDGKTSLRGGFGISYERNFGNVTYNASFNPPASAVVSTTCTANSSNVITNCPYFVTNNDLGPLGQPGPPAPLPPVELRDNYAQINVAQTQFWSLALDHALANNTLISVSYSGAHDVHLYDLNNVNLLGAPQFYLGVPLVTNPNCPQTNPTTGDQACYTRPNSQYTNINQRGSGGSGAYDGLNIKFQTQNLHHTGLTVVANYTYSHSLDDLSSTFSESQTAASLGFTSYTNPKLDWGSSDYDVRNRIVVSPIWQTPWYKDGKGLTGQALGGWSISSVITARSGVPFSVYDFSYLLNYYVVPRLTPATPVTQFHTGTPVLQAGQGNTFYALNIPPPANLGPNDPALGISDFGPFPAKMMRRNAFRGPGAWNTDLALGKTFKLTERFGLEFRAEAFNAFNHANFYAYTNSVQNAYFAPTTVGIPIILEKGGLGNAALGGNKDERRFLQFSLRLMF